MARLNRFVLPLALAVLLAALFTTAANAHTSSRPIHTVTIIADPGLAAPARYGIAKLADALRGKGLVVEENGDAHKSDLAIVAGLAPAFAHAAGALALAHVAAPVEPESLIIRTDMRYDGMPALVLAGSDADGLMYAALDVADRVRWSTHPGHPLQLVNTISEKPFLKERSVVMFTMNRAYFESRLYDEKYWERYFDMMAADRFNCLVLTFGYEDGGYMAPMYPYFFDVPGYPQVHVVGLTPEQQAHNLRAFKAMIRIAAERGIHIKPGIWEHIYRGRQRGQDGGIKWASDGTQPTPGLVWGVDARNLAPYTVAALRKFYQEFPEIKETQFRMHGESGLYDSEIEGFWHQVFGFFSQEHRDILVELRIKGLPKSVVRDAQAQGVKIQLDTKIWMEQMGLPYHPTHINVEDQQNSRHSYADFLEYPQTYHMNWTLWNGGTQRLLLWGDPDYARRMVESARLYDGQGMAVTEMEATKMLGEPHDTKPRDFLNPKYKYTDYEFERYWAFYRIWGRTMYDPSTSPDVWQQEFVERFGSTAGPHVMKALALSSQVLPRIVAACIPYRMFPTTLGWPEMMHMGSLPDYAQTQEGSDIAQFENVRDEAARLLKGGQTAMRRPQDTSAWFASTSDAILAEVAAAEKAIGKQEANKELVSSLADARILAALARYHSWRLRAALNYELYKQGASLSAFDDAIADERRAIQSWRELVDAAGDIYTDNIAFGTADRAFPRHWKDELKPLDAEFGQLLAERKSAAGKPGPGPIVAGSTLPGPVVALPPVQSDAVPGQDYFVAAQVDAPAGIAWIHLCFRHLNQKEDYQSVDMQRVTRSGSVWYEGAIPASFIDPHWDLMYYVEVVDQNGHGRIYPNLDFETPYKVVGVKR